MNTPTEENTNSKKTSFPHLLKCALGATAVLLVFHFLTLVGFNKVFWAVSQVVLTPITLMSYSWTVSLYICGFFVLTFLCMVFTGKNTSKAYKILFIPYLFCLITLLGYGCYALLTNGPSYSSYRLTTQQIFSEDNQEIFDFINHLSPREHYVLSVLGNFTGNPDDIFNPVDEKERLILSNFVTESSRQKTLLVSRKNPKAFGDILQEMRYVTSITEKALYPQCVRLVTQYEENPTINSYMVMKVNDVTVGETNQNACKFGNINTVMFSWDKILFDSERNTQAQPSIIISNTLPPLPPASPPPFN